MVDQVNEYIDAGVQCTYETVRALFMIIRDTCHPGADIKCSDPWIRDFMKRYDFVIRKRPWRGDRRPTTSITTSSSRGAT